MNRATRFHQTTPRASARVLVSAIGLLVACLVAALGWAAIAEEPGPLASSAAGAVAASMPPVAAHGQAALAAVRDRDEGQPAAMAGDVVDVAPRAAEEQVELLGSVLDVAGQPIAGALVAVVPTSGPHEAAGRRWLTFSAEDGSFAFPALPVLDEARLWTQHPGMLTDDRRLSGRVARGVIVQLHAEPAQSPVQGTVYGPSGEPLAGAAVQMGELSASTDAAGSFQLVTGRALRRGTSLFVLAPGCTPVQLPDPRPPHGGPAAPMTVLLRPAVALRGRIVDAAGAPLSEWTVVLADATTSGGQASIEGRLGSTRVVTAGDGCFEFANVFDRTYTIEAWAPRRDGVVRARLAPGDGVVPCVATRPTGVRRGVVLDENGRAVAGVVVGEERLGSEQVGRLGMRFDERATTDGAGRFTLANGGSALHLFVDGEAILPTRVALDVAAVDEPIVVRVRRRCVVRMATATSFTSSMCAFASVDADGAELPACGDDSDRFGVPASAASLLVRLRGVAVGRLPMAGVRAECELCVVEPAPRTGWSALTGR